MAGEKKLKDPGLCATKYAAYRKEMMANPDTAMNVMNAGPWKAANCEWVVASGESQRSKDIKANIYKA